MSTSPLQNPKPAYRNDRTRQLIIDTCDKLLAAKPLNAISVGDICERAAISRPTFYKHFADKYDLIDQSISDKVQASFDVSLPPGAPCTRENLIRLIQTVCEYLNFLRTHLSAALRAQIDPLIEQRVRDYTYTILLFWLTRGAYHKSDDYPAADLQSIITTWAIYGAAQNWQATPDHEPALHYAQRVYHLILSGLDLTEA